MAHTLKETIDLAVKTAILRAHPIGSYYLTEGDENPADFIGGGWNRLKSLVIQASDDKHAAGTTAEAGLPDIQGSLVLHGSEQANIINGTSGAITLNAKYTSYRTPTQLTESSGATSGGALTFKASNYNSIYGASDTVQPPARFVNVWKRVS
jgi:hypothetical protein